MNILKPVSQKHIKHQKQYVYKYPVMRVAVLEILGILWKLAFPQTVHSIYGTLIKHSYIDHFEVHLAKATGIIKVFLVPKGSDLSATRYASQSCAAIACE